MGMHKTKKIFVPPGTICFYCNKEGHIKSECPLKLEDNARRNDRYNSKRYDDELYENDRYSENRYHDEKYNSRHRSQDEDKFSSEERDHKSDKRRDKRDSRRDSNCGINSNNDNAPVMTTSISTTQSVANNLPLIPIQFRTKQVYCYNCGKTGHNGQDCTEKSIDEALEVIFPEYKTSKLNVNYIKSSKQKSKRTHKSINNYISKSDAKQGLKKKTKSESSLKHKSVINLD